MALINWSDSYSVKVDRFDEEHKKLITLINNFHEAMSQGKGNDVIEKVLKSLVAYTKTHFANEESLMKMHNYPGYEDQKKQHELFVKKLEEYQSAVSNGSATISIDVMHFLRDWLLKHISGSDKEYGPFFESKGVS